MRTVALFYILRFAVVPLAYMRSCQRINYRNIR